MFYAAVALNGLVLAILVWAWLRRRHIFLLPSTWVLLLSALFYMLPAILLVEEIAELSPYTWIAMGYCAAFVGAGLLINLVVKLPASLITGWTARGMADEWEKRRLSRHLIGALVVLVVITLWYLLHVPIESTGLFGLLADPDNYAQLREDSLKLLDSVALQYLYLIGFSCLSPLAFTLMMERVASFDAIRTLVVGTFVLLFLSFYLLLTGARVGLVNLAAAGMIYALFVNRLRIGWKSLGAALFAIWIVPIGLSMLREQGRNDAGIFEYVIAIGDRIFLLPLLISGWFIEFAETRGYAGIAAALGIGAQVDWTNEIAMEFLGRKDDITIESVTTPTSFFFTNYLYFGWLGLIPSILALKLMDLPVRYIARLPGALKRPFLATTIFFSLIFVRAGFGVTLISHGYIVLAVWIFVASRRGKDASSDIAAERPVTNLERSVR